MIPLPNRLPVPYGHRPRDAAAEFAKLELRDGGAWLLAPAEVSAARANRRFGSLRPIGRLAEVARAVGAFLF